ncbi:MAG: glycoside hydrolase family 27 protein [Pseudomonadota bacterium]|nr:glycoside hydrolase family 27 protein [Pseudomonadota bacterium]
MKLSRRSALGLAAATPLIAASTAKGATKRPRLLAPTPPMGWNSWNSFGPTINEQQVRENAQIMVEKLLPSGYNVFTIDIQWYEPEAKSYTYNSNPVPAMDEYGRLLPAPNRFPSSVGGKGFAPLAADIHRTGLKFGIHLMRGIPRHAVKLNTKVLGTNYRAQDIADTSSICPWNPDMYGVDMRRPGAQAYYNSVFALFASWGVDFVKMDDMSRPYDSHAPEIEAAHNAIVASRRPMVLSLSPGETAVPRAEHVRRYAEMWRISDDFWDEWSLLESQFTRLENWNPHLRPGRWPDADMLPLGRLALGERDTKFTPAEQKTVMTLWSIARSPLIMGGDLRHLDAPTLALLTNPEVLAVNQASTGNQPYFVEDGMRVWTARPANGSGRYLALFNTTNKEREIGIDFRWIGVPGQVRVRDLWERKDIGSASVRFAAPLPPHGAGMFKLTNV